MHILLVLLFVKESFLRCASIWFIIIKLLFPVENYNVSELLKYYYYIAIAS
jgi:hypothetical protein